MDIVVVATFTAKCETYNPARKIVFPVLPHHHEEYATSTDLTLEEFYSIYKIVHFDVFPIVPIPLQDNHDNVLMTDDVPTTNLVATSPVRNCYSMNRVRAYNTMTAAATHAADEQRTNAAP